MDGWLPQLEDLAFSCFLLLVCERLLDKSGWKNLLAEFTGMAFNANHHVDGESFRDDFFRWASNFSFSFSLFSHFICV